MGTTRNASGADRERILRKVASVSDDDIRQPDRIIDEVDWNFRLLAGVIKMMPVGRQRDAVVHALIEEMGTVVYQFAFTIAGESVAAIHRRKTRAPQPVHASPFGVMHN